MSQTRFVLPPGRGVVHAPSCAFDRSPGMIGAGSLGSALGGRLLCGHDAGAKRIVEALVRDLGAHPVDAGPLEAARLVEPAMMLATSIAYAGVPRDVGLRLLERTGSVAGTGEIIGRAA